ncbi:MAG: LysR family transcriptional regulator [Enhygromyxa sp.]
MDLDELRGFLAVVESGSFHGAAIKLDVPRATLRRRIDALEARAGVPLLGRSARGVTVTEAGALIVERGRRLLIDGASLLAAAREVGRVSSKPLRVHLPVGLPPTTMVAFAQLRRSLLPALRLQLIVGATPLASSREHTDLAVHFGESGSGEPYLMRELVRVPIRLLASAAYLARHGRPRGPDELQHHALAGWLEPGADPQLWPLRGGGQLDVAPAFTSNDAHALRQLARADLVIARLPDADLDLFGLTRDELEPVLDDVIVGEVTLNLSVAAPLAGLPEVARLLGLVAEFVGAAGLGC